MAVVWVAASRAVVGMSMVSVMTKCAAVECKHACDATRTRQDWNLLDIVVA